MGRGIEDGQTGQNGQQVRSRTGSQGTSTDGQGTSTGGHGRAGGGETRGQGNEDRRSGAARHAIEDTAGVTCRRTTMKAPLTARLLKEDARVVLDDHRERGTLPENLREVSRH